MIYSWNNHLTSGIDDSITAPVQCLCTRIDGVFYFVKLGFYDIRTRSVDITPFAIHLHLSQITEYILRPVVLR